MQFSSDDGPRPDRAVMRCLREIDPTLYPVWRWWQMDQITGRPLLRQDGRRLFNPQWYIVKECRDGRHRVLFTVKHFDYRVPHRIKTDVGRFMRAQEINAMLDAQREARESQAEIQHTNEVSEFVKANRRKINTVFDGDNLKRPAVKRDQKIMSYPGQTNRTSARASILPDAKEAGWELPWAEERNEP